MGTALATASAFPWRFILILNHSPECGSAARLSNNPRSIRQALRTADQLIAGNQNQAGNLQEVAQNLSRQIDQIDQQIGQGQAQEASAYQPAPQQQNRDREQQQQRQQNNDQSTDSNGR
ncbi:MAG TPA: hypothetical protein VK797_06575 [Tepidisphaeraceae bacterium]|nr:hypothetical protein [Tepidisphaeraceae bacterium]